jgi:hypothetical protein
MQALVVRLLLVIEMGGFLMRDTPQPVPPPASARPIPLSYSTSAGLPGKPKRHEVYLMAAVLAVLLAVSAVLFYVLVVAPPTTVTRTGNTIVYTTVAAPTAAMEMLFWCATLLSFAIAGICSVYWLIWILVVHREMAVFTAGQYPVSPGQAVGFCFIPFFNLYWIVWMPHRLARELESMLGPGRISAGRVMTWQILSILPGGLLFGLGSLFRGIAMARLQAALNELWKHSRPQASVRADSDDAAARLAAMDDLA